MPGNLDQLERLAELRRKGTLTAEEYQLEKGKLLSGGGEEPSSAFWERNRKWLTPLCGVIGLIIAITVVKPLLRQTEDIGGDYEQLCILAPVFSEYGLNHRVADLTGPARSNGSNVSWERVGSGVIVHMERHDPLTDEDHDFRLELTKTPNAAPAANCNKATEGAVVSRLSLDGEAQAGFAAGIFLQNMLGGAGQ